eukprot:scaffold87717_cov64-Phaeocystis_antarctica.AAC.12
MEGRGVKPRASSCSSWISRRSFSPMEQLREGCSSRDGRGSRRVCWLTSSAETRHTLSKVRAYIASASRSVAFSCVLPKWRLCTTTPPGRSSSRTCAKNASERAAGGKSFWPSKMSMKTASKLGGAGACACALTHSTPSSTITATPLRSSPRCDLAASTTAPSSSSATHVAPGTWASMNLGSDPAPSPRKRQAGELTAPPSSRPASASAASDLSAAIRPGHSCHAVHDIELRADQVESAPALCSFDDLDAHVIGKLRRRREDNFGGVGSARPPRGGVPTIDISVKWAATRGHTPDRYRRELEPLRMAQAQHDGGQHDGGAEQHVGGAGGSIDTAVLSGGAPASSAAGQTCKLLEGLTNEQQRSCSLHQTPSSHGIVEVRLDHCDVFARRARRLEAHAVVPARHLPLPAHATLRPGQLPVQHARHALRGVGVVHYGLGLVEEATREGEHGAACVEVIHQRAAIEGHREERVRSEIGDGRSRLVDEPVLALHLLDELVLPVALVAFHVRVDLDHQRQAALLAEVQRRHE